VLTWSTGPVLQVRWPVRVVPRPGGWPDRG